MTDKELDTLGFVDEQAEREIITIQMKQTLVAGNSYRISMNFVSILNTDLRGFYRSSYVEDEKTK